MLASSSYFVRTGEHRFQPTIHTSGAWKVDEQHISPMNGLVVHELERWFEAQPADGLVISRISYDILGVLDMRECELAFDVMRPGRGVQLVEVVVSQGGRAAVRARVWRVATTDTAEVAGGVDEPMPGPLTCDPWDMTAVWPGQYIADLDVRTVQPPAPGRARTWMSTPITLVADELSSELARFVGLVDTTNGIAVRQSPDAWHFPNVDLTIHLLRQPRGRWIGFDTTVAFGEAGAGITSAVLHDEHGQVGRAAQALVVRPR